MSTFFDGLFDTSVARVKSMYTVSYTDRCTSCIIGIDRGTGQLERGGGIYHRTEYLTMLYLFNCFVNLMILHILHFLQLLHFFIIFPLNFLIASYNFSMRGEKGNFGNLVQLYQFWYVPWASKNLYSYRTCPLRGGGGWQNPWKM